ncbi:MAG: protein kinase [Pseudoxanthomonas sp.]|nr:protein kinase [Pseudoxanthomonas sp.]
MAEREPTRRIAESIADERPVDWRPAERALGPDDPELASLRLLDDVARAFRATGSPPPRPARPVLFRWGHLEVTGRLGAGLTGEVFAAWDPVLQREVALKLRASRDPASDPANHQLLAEARQLAGIRHGNVLAVYGAAVHDGRAGLWSELIDGAPLSARLEADGPMALTEVLHIGLDLCRALAQVHGAGLVHGDIKAENVMRERGGRIVLMDFGASGRREDLAARLLQSGTRAYLSPARQAGAPPTAADDLHALAVLLHLLLAGRFPEPGTALADQRPDLPAAACAALDRLRLATPADRPASAAGFARVLLDLLPDREAPSPTRPRRALLAASAAAVVVLVAALAWWRAPAPAWQGQAEFVDVDSGRVLADDAEVGLGDALRLRLASDAGSHVYVVNEDSAGALAVLFPLPGLDLGNPLPAGSHELPGTAGGRPLAWEIASDAEHEAFLVIASRSPLPALAQALAELAPATAGADGTVRGAGRLRHAGATAEPAGGLDRLERIARADGRVHLVRLRLRHRDWAPGSAD